MDYLNKTTLTFLDQLIISFLGGVFSTLLILGLTAVFSKGILNLIRKRLQSPIDVLKEHPRSYEFKGYVRNNRTRNIYPYIDKKQASNRTVSYKIIMEDDSVIIVSADDYKLYTEFDWKEVHKRSK